MKIDSLEKFALPRANSFSKDYAEIRSDERLLRLPHVLALSGFKKTKLYQMIKIGDFPCPIKLGKRISVWPQSKIDEWLIKVIS